MRVLQVQLEIEADPAEVGRARNWARSRLVRCGMATDEPLSETLLLLISELVTNAVVHTGAPAVLRMLLPGRHTPGAVRVEVTDLSSRPPRQRHTDDEDTNGRGLELVSALADRWGWQIEGAGKRIWFELDRSAAAELDCAVGGWAGSIGSGASSVQLAASVVSGGGTEATGNAGATAGVSGHDAHLWTSC